MAHCAKAIAKQRAFIEGRPRNAVPPYRLG
jgi:hypothetical protein